MMAFILKVFPALFPILVALAGMGLIAYGAALFCLPAGYVVGGVLLIVAVIDSRS
jgi:hypothetical protein